jgi:DNA invertase Pin-like site-specific DNA recombinase
MLLGYTRVSTAGQGDDGKTSLERQEQIIRGFAMSKGFTQFDVSIYSDNGVSASIPLSQRPNGGRLFADAKSGDIIVAAKLDRMFRSASDALNLVEIFKERGIDLVLFDLGSEPVNSSGVGQFFFTVIAAVAQLERTMIKERCVNGKKAKIARGGHVGGRSPYGFRVIGQGCAAQLEPVEAEQQVLAKVRSWLTERAEIGVAETCRRLAEEGAKARSGKPFVMQQVIRIMDQARAKSN